MERELIQDLLFILQGIDGKYIYYNNTKIQNNHQPKANQNSTNEQNDVTNILFNIQFIKNVNLSNSFRDFVEKIGEMGCLLLKIRLFIDQTKQATKSHKKPTLTKQSLASALEQQIVEFYEFVSVLEYQIQSNSIQSLRKIFYFAYNLQIFEKMKILCLIVEDTEKLEGKFHQIKFIN